MSKYAVEVKDVKKSFFLPNHKNNSLKQAITQAFKPKEKGGKTFNALDGISFNVEKGDFFGILGRNGSGKSTLLKIISEIYQPTSGSVTHDGKLVSFIELGVGFKPDLSGRENVFLNGGLLGFTKKEVEDMYDEIVSFAELEPFMDQKLKNYSSGMKVRLAFSVAIRAKADILILDEVLAVGDAAFRKKCSNYFKTLKEDHKTVILVTHSMADVREYCNKAIVIDGGKVTYEGEAEGAASEYLQLFNTKDGGVKPSRTGNRKVAFENVDVSYDQKTISIKATLHTESQPVENVKLGMRVKNSANGNVLAGASTLNADNSPGLFSLQANESRTIEFIMTNILGNGNYSISATLNSPEGETFDNWEDLAKIHMDRDHVYYPLVIPTTVK